MRQAREIRGFTQSETADRIGVSQPSIAHIESGRMLASNEIIDRISWLTGFPVPFFEQPEPQPFPLGSLVYFRSRRAASSREQTQAYRYAQVLYETTTKLSVKIKDLPIHINELREAPGRAARITRVALGLPPEGPILNLTDSLENAGVLIYTIPLNIERIDAFSLWVRSAQSKPVVAVLSGKPGDRQRFSLAHELGHLILSDHEVKSVSQIERLADRFAGELLLPEKSMREEITTPLTFSSLIALKQRWRVSMQAIVMRAGSLGIITERQKRYFFMKLNKSGMLKQEPVSIQPEAPRRLRESIELLYGDYRISDVARDLMLPEFLLRGTLESAGEIETGSGIYSKEVGDVVELPAE